MSENYNKPTTDASLIRPERSYVEIPTEESRNLAFPPSAAISAISGLFSLFAVAILTAVFNPIPVMQIVFYCLGTATAALAAISGIRAIIRLRKSIIPRGRFSAWVGLVLGLAVLAVAINAALPVIAHGCDASVSCKDGQYFIDRPEGWIVLPSNTFDVTSDAEMLKIDGTGFAVINRLNKKSAMDGLANFLTYVYRMPYVTSHSHHHEHTDKDSTMYAFRPVSVSIAKSHREELKAAIKVEIAGVKKSIAADERKKQDKIIADSLAQRRRRLAALKTIKQPADILKYLVIKKLGPELGETYPGFRLEESTATTKDGMPIVEITFSGLSNEGDSCACLAMLWFTDKKRFQIIAFTENPENLPALRADMLKAVAGFRTAEQ